MKKENHKKKQEWHKYIPWLILLIIGIALAVTIYSDVKELKSVPTCLYGCDYYYETGIALDLMNNPGNSWQSSTHDYLNSVNSIPKTHAYTRALFAKLGNLDYYNSWKSVFGMSYFFIFIGLVGWFLVYKKMFKNQYLAIALTVFTMNFTDFPLFKYRSLFIPMIPYFIYLILKLNNRHNNIKKDLWIGTGLTLLAVYISNIHAMSFFIIYFMIFFAYFIFILKTIKPKQIIHKLKNKLIIRKTWIYALFTGLSLAINIALGWWYKILFIIGGDENAFKFDIHPNLNNGKIFFNNTVNHIKTIFFNFSNLEKTLITSLLLIAIIAYIIFKRKNKIDKNNIVKWVIIFFLFSVFNYIITVPLVHKHLSPGHAIGLLLPFFLSSMIGLLLLTISKIKELKIHKTGLIIISLILIVILTISAISAIKEKHEKDKFWQNGKNEIPANYKAIREWVKENNMNPSNMVILSTNELSFALHGILGTKHIAGRQSHFFHFDDFQSYWLDSAIILYGKNNQMRKAELEKWNSLITSKDKKFYLYWDYYWINSEWQISEQNVQPFDPFRFEYTNEIEQELKENQITYTVIKDAIFEPSAQNNPNAHKMDIIYLTPENYNNAIQPWNNDLNQYLKEVWSYEQQGQTLSILYEVNI
jgi:hypothetical protein